MNEAAATLRQEWKELLGAERPSDASWNITEESGARKQRRFAIEVTSYGASFHARLVVPDSRLPRAVVVIPFYDVESLFGEVSPLYPDPEARPTRAFAREFVAAGFAVLAVPWWAECAARGTGTLDLHERYAPVATAHLGRHPQVTGLGRSVAELQLALDALSGMEEIDPSRIGAFGHSLGGKLALFAMALDTRISAAVTHEPGLGFAHSNWSDPWYFGERLPKGRDLDEILALSAPRPVLYAGGGAADGAHNEALALAAASPDSRITIRHHASGHPLPEPELAQMITWLRGELLPSPH